MLPSVLLLLYSITTVSFSIASEKPQVVIGNEPMKCSRVVCDGGGVVNDATTPTSSGDYSSAATEIAACEDCRFCADRGFSACLRSEGQCLCDHFLPENCDLEDSRETKHGAVTEEYCYQYALRKLPSVHPHTMETYTSVDVKQFWLEPYWSALQPERLVFNYKYKELVPEYCMGYFLAQNVCVSTIDMDMSQDFDGLDWPLELQIDNDVFDHTEKAEFWITVDVIEPSYTKGNVWVNVTSEITVLDLKSSSEESVSEEEGEDTVIPETQSEFLKDYGIHLIVATVAVLFLVLLAIVVYCCCRPKKAGYVAGKVERA